MFLLNQILDFNTWMGDPIRALQAKEMIKYIDNNDLINLTKNVGGNLYSNIKSLSERSVIENVRGWNQGTFIAFDLPSSQQRDKLVSEMRNNGVNVGACGDRSLRLRPMLIFNEIESQLLLQCLQSCITNI